MTVSQESVVNDVPDISRIMDYESGELSYDETIELFQDLVDTGLAWQLQDHYGRAAKHLIDTGVISMSNQHQ